MCASPPTDAKWPFMVVVEEVGGLEADGAPWPFAPAWDVAIVYRVLVAEQAAQRSKEYRNIKYCVACECVWWWLGGRGEYCLDGLAAASPTERQLLAHGISRRTANPPHDRGRVSRLHQCPRKVTVSVSMPRCVCACNVRLSHGEHMWIHLKALGLSFVVTRGLLQKLVRILLPVSLGELDIFFPLAQRVECAADWLAQ